MPLCNAGMHGKSNWSINIHIQKASIFCGKFTNYIRDCSKNVLLITPSPLDMFRICEKVDEGIKLQAQCAVLVKCLVS